MERSEIEQIFRLFEQENPNPQTELFFTNAFTCMVAVILSAQATDRSVNKTLQPIIIEIDTPEKVLALGENRLQDLFKSINIYRNKSHYIYETSKILIQRYRSQLPLHFKDLTQLPGIGQKTANVLLNVLADDSKIAVDTHVFRVAQRIGIASAKNPILLEEALYRAIPSRFWGRVNHWLVLHGRRICKARTPACEQCLIRPHCQYYKALQK